MSDQRHAEHFVGDGDSFLGVMGNIDSAAFAASAGVNLRLHHHAAGDGFRGRLGFGGGTGHLAARHRYIEVGQDSFGLVLMNFHGNVRAPTSVTVLVCRKNSNSLI